MAKRFYPSTKKVQKNDIEWQKMADFTQNNGKNLILNLNAPVQFNDEGVVKTHEQWQNKFQDEWVNPVANVGVNNSIMQYSEWINNRLSYAECAFLANDSIINNALTKIANEMLRKGGEIIIDSEDEVFVNELKNKIESRLKELDFWHILHKAIVTSLTYGGALIFTDCNAEDLSNPLYENKAIFSQNPIKALKVVEPYLCGANDVNATNPLNADFMIPNMWFVSGGGQVHKSRIETLIMFESPDMIKPLYNYLGISLCQFMRDYVMSADISRKGLADIFQRFRTIIIKSPLIKNNIDQAIKRINAINRQRNNNSAIALTEDEDYIETITSITGLDKLIAQMQENIAISARIPAVKLLGLTPSGFNATGDFDMRSYYDEIMSLQNAILKPIVNRYLHFICLEFGYDIKPDFEFDRLDSDNALNEVQIKNTEAQMMLNLIQGGVITQETAFNYLRNKGILPNSAEFESDLDGDLDLDLPNDDNDDNADAQQTKDNYFMDAIEYDPITGREYFVGTGYHHGIKMSNNALFDYQKGIKPIKDYTSADARLLEKTLGLKKGSIKTQDLKRQFFGERADSWHHIGKNYKEEDFYSLETLLSRRVKSGEKLFGVEVTSDMLDNFSKEYPKLSFAQSITKGKNPFYEDLDDSYFGNIKQDEMDLFKEQVENAKEYFSADDFSDIQHNIKENNERNQAEKAKKEAREKAEYERRKKAEAEAEARKKEPKVKNPVNKLINDLGIEARALNKEPDSPEKFKKLSEMHDKLLELSHQTDATSPFVFAQKVAGEIKYAKEKAKEIESQGSGEWDEKDHPRNPDGSFKKK